MIDRVQMLQKGTVYRIRNRKTKQCLCLYSKLQIKTSPEEQTPDQLWVLNQVKNEEYQIIHLKAGTVLAFSSTKDRPIVNLERQKKVKEQFWSIIFGQTIQGINLFWIKPSTNLTLSLRGSALSDRIQLSAMDQTLSICLWQFDVYPSNGAALSDLSIFHSETSNLVMDISDIASKEGINIIQYSFTGAGNQRWKVEAYKEKKEGIEEYTIRNYSSGLNLTAVFSKGSIKVIQALFNCSPDQRWRLLPAEGKQNVFIIQSVSNGEYYLGRINEKGGSLVTLIQDRLKSGWTIQGRLPGA